MGKLPKHKYVERIEVRPGIYEYFTDVNGKKVKKNKQKKKK
jgi:hypothetical protein